MKTTPKLELEEKDLNRLKQLVSAHDREKDDAKAGHLYECITNEVEELIFSAFELGVNSQKSLPS